MDINEKINLTKRHPNYRLMFLSSQQLVDELSNWKRDDIIEWLKWNDPNGIYRDEESLAEMGNIMTYDEAVKLIMKQVRG
jgi:N-acetylmuramoyl-L-alanine amidase CwlA